MNPYAKLGQIIKKMREMDFEELIISFTDGTELFMTEDQLGDMFDSVMDGREPNEEALLFLNKLQNGIEDENGICHLVEAMSTDPAELWSGEEWI